MLNPITKIENLRKLYDQELSKLNKSLKDKNYIIIITCRQGNKWLRVISINILQISQGFSGGNLKKKLGA